MITVFFTLLLTGNILLKPLRNIDNIWLDFAIKQWSQDKQADPSIIVIDIDDTSLQAMQYHVGRWPWPRSVHAELLKYLLLQRPKAIIFDILFSEPDIYRPDADKYLSEVIENSSNIFLPILHLQSNQPHLFSKLSDYPATVGLQNHSLPTSAPQVTRANLLLPTIISPTSWQLGTINFVSDADGVGRVYQVKHQIEQWSLDSLPTKVARYLGATIPQQREIIIDWSSKPADNSLYAYNTYSYAAVYQASSREQVFVNQLFFKNKIIIIGATATGLHDIKNTPISENYPGTYILATAIDNLLHHQHLSLVTPLAQWLSAFIFLLLLTFTLLSDKHILSSAIGFFILSLGYYLISYFLVSQKWLIPSSSTVLILSVYFLTVTIIQFLQRQREYSYAIDIFGRFMDPNVVRQLVDSGQTKQALQPKNCKVTVLFSDIRNFTTLSEKQTALQIVELLDIYFSMQVGVIFNHQGTLDKFIGDAIMAFWGAPIANDDQEKQAIEAALVMVDKLEKFRQQQQLPEFDIGIGIHTGEVVVGAIGGEQRYDYTVIGDTVNVASRIEGATKGHCNILVSASTRSACADHFDFIEQGDYKLKGREEAVTLYIPKRKSQ